MSNLAEQRQDPPSISELHYALIDNVLGRGYRLVCQANGDFTINGDGLAVAETIEANEYEFTEAGKMIHCSA